ncbi:hypothetical protein SERLADRAFT_398802, partial [Serpula lacrymans var. lacrymans S7.9]
GRKRKVDWKGEKGDSLDAMAYWVRGWWEDGFFRDEESGSDKNGEVDYRVKGTDWGVVG